MAFDKRHIDGLKKEITLVNKLTDKTGCLVMLNMASAIFKVKDNNEKHPVLKKYLTEIINNLDNHNEDYYRLVQETLKENSTTEKNETEIPTLDYWMLNTISDALQKEYDRYAKSSNIAKGLSKLADEKGFKFAKKSIEELDSNKYHPLGQIALSIKRIEEIKEAITLEVKGN